jgi:hypothetical protein
MYKNAFCPISEKRVNTAVVRTHALISVAVLLAFIFTQNLFVALFLLSDFLVRVLNFPRLSLLGVVARWIVNTLGIQGKQENAGPKLFAARIGLLFTLIIAGSLIFGSVTLSVYAAIVLAFFSFLEGAFGFCVACVIYPWVHKLLYRVNESRA